MSEVFSQSGFAARFDWGEPGLRLLAPSVDVLVLVDVLSFTTAVDVAVSRGGRVYPYHLRDATAADFAASLGAALAVDRRRTSAEQPFSLSPRSLTALSSGMSVVLPSLNGSALTLHAAEHHRTVLAGCLRNASAVAKAAQASGTVAVIAAGEYRRDGTLRFALEDLVGAGAILSHVAPDKRSPEAEIAVAAFERVALHLPRYIQECASGRELIGLGFADDVAMAADLDASDVVPRFQTDSYSA